MPEIKLLKEFLIAQRLLASTGGKMDDDGEHSVGTFVLHTGQRPPEFWILNHRKRHWR
jgi:hypothetical protein